MVFWFFEAGDINEISEIGHLNNVPVLCGTDQVQGFEVHPFISGILVSLSNAHFTTSYVTANIWEQVPTFSSGNWQ